MPTKTSPPPLRDPVAPGEPPRRGLAAGHVVVVGLVCLLVGALLNAPGIRKTAAGQDVGWRRDVARFFADPLYDVSHTLRIDRVREGIQDAVGRSSDDEFDPRLPSPTIDEPGTSYPVFQAEPPTTTVPPRRAFSPRRPMRVWVGGDSLSITPGESLINLVPGTQVASVIGGVDGHVSTGLARPEVFNWPAHLSSVVASSQPDALVLTIGSNDDQPLTGAGGVGPFGSAPWQAEYRRRVGGLMDAVTSNRRVLFWVGIPIIRNVARAQSRYQLMNDIFRSEAAKRPGRVLFVETYELLSAPGGAYADHLPDASGQLVRLRAPDGIHFTRAGGDVIARQVIEAMYGAFDLTSWETSFLPDEPTTQPPTTTTTTKKRRQRNR